MNATKTFSGFDDLEDDFGSVATEASKPATIEEASGMKSAKAVQVDSDNMYREACPKCGGSGVYTGYSTRGRHCFKCNGRGYLAFKTSPEQRALARTRAAEKKIKAAEMEAKNSANRLAEFEAANPAIAAWWADTDFQFALSLRDYCAKNGTLTENQKAAALRCIEKVAAMKAERAAAAAKDAARGTLDVSKIVEAIDRAQDKGIKRPVMRLASDDFLMVISPASARSVNFGSLYVNLDSKSGVYIGKITNGAFHRSRDCSDAHVDALYQIFQQPLEAAVAYGRRTGTCSCCGRELTNGESINLGIGPVCRTKFFG